MSHLSSRRKTQRGATLFLLIVIVFILLPAVFLMLQRSIFQNRLALHDRNIKTSREMAESIGTDFMNSFSSDWHRDSFSELYATHNNPTYANLGKAVSTLTILRSSATIRIQTVATYDKGGALPARERVTRGVDALYTWVSDSLKFDYVWNTPVAFGANLDQAFNQANLGQMDNSVFVRGDFDSGTSSFPFKINGFWVVKGTFTLRDPARLENGAIIHCYAFNNVGGAHIGGATIRQIPADNFFPNFEIIPPEGGGVPGSLSYYDTRKTTGVVIPPGETRLFELLSANQYRITRCDATFLPIDPPVTANFFPAVATSTVPFTIVFKGGLGVEVSTCSVARPITVVAIDTPVRVTGNVTYSGSLTAKADRTFALLSEKSITFQRTSPQQLCGFYGTTLGTLHFLSDKNVAITGTISGPIGTYGAPWGTLLTVRADSQLGRFPPPLFPRRPRIIMWDYVP